MLKEGDPAPEFSAPDEAGKEISLRGLKGKKVVLYFYPKDDTPGCTREACGFRDELPKFSKVNAVIYGVSRDTSESHQQFIKKYSLPFSLLSDTDQKLCTAYEVLDGKSLNRSTFLIDEAGKILKIFRNVKVDGHIEKVLEQF